MQRFRLQGRVIFPELSLVAARGISVRLEPKAMELLLELAKYPREVVSKTHILQTVWAGVFVCEDVIANAVCALRKALGDETKSPSLIQTVPKRGYRLLSPVEWVTSDIVSDPSAPPNDVNRYILRARHLRHEETVPSLNSACAYCEEIIRQEPNCAVAYAELALALLLLEKLGAVRRQDVEPKVRTAVDHAVRLDERASMSLICLAKQEYRYDWQWEKAEQHFRKAVEVGSTESDVFAEFSIMLSVLRRFEESLDHARMACSLDAMSPAARLQAGHANYASGRWNAAAAEYRHLLRFTPQHVFARWGLADALTRVRKPHEAMAILEQGLSMVGADPPALLLIALSRIRAMTASSRGRPGYHYEAEEGTQDPVLLAELYGSCGETAKAFKQLEEAVETKHYRLSAVNMFPQFDPLRADQSYGRLVQRIGLRQ